jgi:hypothetical protein
MSSSNSTVARNLLAFAPPTIPSLPDGVTRVVLTAEEEGLMVHTFLKRVYDDDKTVQAASAAVMDPVDNHDMAWASFYKNLALADWCFHHISRDLDTRAILRTGFESTYKRLVGETASLQSLFTRQGLVDNERRHLEDMAKMDLEVIDDNMVFINTATKGASGKTDPKHDECMDRLTAALRERRKALYVKTFTNSKAAFDSLVKDVKTGVDGSASSSGSAASAVDSETYPNRTPALLAAIAKDNEKKRLRAEKAKAVRAAKKAAAAATPSSSDPKPGTKRKASKGKSPTKPKPKLVLSPVKVTQTAAAAPNNKDEKKAPAAPVVATVPSALPAVVAAVPSDPSADKVVKRLKLSQSVSLPSKRASDDSEIESDDDDAPSKGSAEDEKKLALASGMTSEELKLYVDKATDADRIALRDKAIADSVEANVLVRMFHGCAGMSTRQKAYEFVMSGFPKISANDGWFNPSNPDSVCPVTDEEKKILEKGGSLADSKHPIGWRRLYEATFKRLTAMKDRRKDVNIKSGRGIAGKNLPSTALRLIGFVKPNEDEVITGLGRKKKNASHDHWSFPRKVAAVKMSRLVLVGEENNSRGDAHSGYPIDKCQVHHTRQPLPWETIDKELTRLGALKAKKAKKAPVGQDGDADASMESADTSGAKKNQKKKKPAPETLDFSAKKAKVTAPAAAKPKPVSATAASSSSSVFATADAAAKAPKGAVAAAVAAAGIDMKAIKATMRALNQTKTASAAMAASASTALVASMAH